MARVLLTETVFLVEDFDGIGSKSQSSTISSILESITKPMEAISSTMKPFYSRYIFESQGTQDEPIVPKFCTIVNLHAYNDNETLKEGSFPMREMKKNLFKFANPILVWYTLQLHVENHRLIEKPLSY
jgi:hypothetical protein